MLVLGVTFAPLTGIPRTCTVTVTNQSFPFTIEGGLNVTVTVARVGARLSWAVAVFSCGARAVIVATH
jgi:hypothetical protein